MAGHSTVDIDFGGSKAALGCVSTIRKQLEESDFSSLSHSLGLPLSHPDVSVREALGGERMTALQDFLSPYASPVDPQKVHSHFFVATEPGRQAQAKMPGEFSKIFFEKTGFFPWVISGRLEAKIMAYALRSSASFSWKRLCHESAVMHLHPGSQSLELTLSSHGHSTYGENTFQGYEAHLGFRRTEFSGHTVEDFLNYKNEIKERILNSEELLRVINHSKDCPDLPCLVASGKASRKLIGRALAVKGVASKLAPRGSDQWLDNSILHVKDLEDVVPKLIDKLLSAKDEKSILGKKAEVYACAVLMSMLEIVSHEVRDKGVFISDARLVYGINELRKMGSNDHYLIPEMCKDMYDEFFMTLMHTQFNSAYVHKTAETLQGIFTFLRGDEERKGLNYVALLHALGSVSFESFQNGAIPLGSYFGANRFPGMPRDTQEDILTAMIGLEPQNLNQKLVSGIIKLVSAIYSDKPFHPGISYGVSGSTLEIRVSTQAELESLKVRSPQIQCASKQIGLDGVSFSFR